MVISILTLFPQLFTDFLNTSIIKRAISKQLVKIRIIDIRSFALDKHKTADDRPFGGGPGMIIKIDIVEPAIRYAKKLETPKKPKVLLLDPAGRVFTQKIAVKLSSIEHLILVCGHYEGIDARINNYIDGKVSIGKYILTGGEIPSMVISDSIIRLLPNVLSNSLSIREESFSANIKKEQPQYTRPYIYKNHKVPDILLSGNHKKILIWKKKSQVKLLS